MANATFIDLNNLKTLLAQAAASLSDTTAPCPVYAPAKTYEHFQFKKVSAGDLDQIVIGPYRALTPLKQFFYPLAENVLSQTQNQPLIVVGVKACDLAALTVIDTVYGSGPLKDPFYLARRQNAFIISSDCTNAKDSCFCNLVWGKPYPEKGFDLNLSEIKDGFIVECGSEKGAKLMAENAALFTSTPPGAVEQKDRLRQAMEARVNSQNQNYTFKASLTNIHRQTLENVAAWRQITKDCVDCQACNRVCPSCTCFLLVDQFHHGEEEKIKVWDNCLHGSYTRVAGGTNDRGALFSRLQNRYHCKFDYMVSRTGNAACVGCGRCIDACLGKIDMRTVFKTLEKAAVLSAKLI